MGGHNVAEAIVRVDGLSKTYGRLHALEGVGFSIRAGEILGLIGPNGAGKTTLFECVRRFGARGSGRHLFRPGARRRATPFGQAVLRPRRHRSVAGSTGALGAGIQSRLF